MANDPLFDHVTQCRNVLANGRRTSIRLHRAIWDAVEEICRIERLSLNQLVSDLDKRRGGLSLTEALRIYSISYFREACRAEASVEPGPSPRRRFHSRTGRKIIRMMLAARLPQRGVPPQSLQASR